MSTTPDRLTDDGDQVQVSQDGATEAIWAPDGRELFYRTTHRGGTGSTP